MQSFAEILEDALRNTSPSRPVGAFERIVSDLGSLLADATPALLSPSAPEGAARDLVLGLDTPRTLAEARHAFRRMALQTHPDRPGGSHEAFLRTQALYDEARAALTRAAAVSFHRVSGSRGPAAASHYV